MLVAQEADGRSVTLAEHEVADDGEPRGAPGGDELVGAVPAVEADAKSAVLQDAVHFGESWLQPASVAVARDAAARAVAVVHEIGRIGQDKIDALGWQSAHKLNAIAEHDGVGGFHGDHPLLAWR
jgi:hypothetical protein